MVAPSQAAADFFGVRIAVLSSYRHSCFLEIEPAAPRSQRTLWLSFWAEVRRRVQQWSGRCAHAVLRGPAHLRLIASL